MKEKLVAENDNWYFYRNDDCVKYEKDPGYTSEFGNDIKFIETVYKKAERISDGDKSFLVYKKGEAIGEIIINSWTKIVNTILNNMDVPRNFWIPYDPKYR